MGILRLGDENHDEGGRGPNLSRRGALKLSAGSIATFAMATAGGVTSAVLTSPEAAQAQAVTDGGYLPNVPASTIRLYHQMPLRDAQFASTSWDSDFFYADYNWKILEDTGGWNMIDYADYEGAWYDHGDICRTVYLRDRFNTHDWKWLDSYDGRPHRFAFYWRNYGCDEDGDAVDVWIQVRDMGYRNTTWDGVCGYGGSWGNGSRAAPVFSTMVWSPSKNADAINHVGDPNYDLVVVPMAEALCTCEMRCNIWIQIVKAGTGSCSLGDGCGGAPAKGTYLLTLDGLDSYAGMNWGNPNVDESVSFWGGATKVYYKNREGSRKDFASGTFTTNTPSTQGQLYTLENGIVAEMRGTGIGYTNAGMMFRTQLMGQFWYPLTLRAFPMAKREGDKWPIAPGFYMFKSSVLGKDNVHMWDHGYGDGSKYQWGSGGYDHNSIFMVTPYYAGGDRGDKKGYEDGYRISSLRSGLSHMDYWGFADCSSAAAHNYVNNSVNQRINIDDAGDGFYYVHCGDQYLSGYPGRPEDYLGWCKKSAAERDLKWDIVPWCHVADWAPENLYCKYDVSWNGGVYGTFTTDANGYAAQIDTSMYGHNLAPSNGYDPYDMKLEYASWTSTRPADNAIQNSSTFGHLQYLFVQKSPWPCNYVRSAVPMNRGHLCLAKTVRKKSAGEVIPNGYYFIHSAGDEGYCLDVQWGDTANGTLVQLYQENRTLGQLWVVTNYGNGEIRLAPACNMCERLDALGSSSQDAQLNIWYNNGAANQKWTPVKSINGGYALRAKGTNLAVDVQDGHFANGSRVRLWPANGAAAQSWVFEPLDASADNNTLDESSLPDDPLSANTNWQYKLYTDEKLQNEVATFDYDSAGGGNAIPIDAEGNEYLPYIGRPFWLRETVAGDGCQLDGRTYKLTIPCAVGTEKFQVMSGVFWLDMVDLPDGAVTVHFVCLDKDVKATEVSSYQVPCGADVSTSDEGFAAADALLAGFYGVGDTSFVLKWFEGTKDKEPGGDVFNDPSKSFSGRDRVGEDIWLYAWCQTATVTFYCDGTDEDHVIMVDESVLRLGASEAAAAGGRMRPASLRRASGKKVKARFTGMYLGTKFTVPGGIYEAAALPGCTPGWDGWYTDKDDLAVTSDTPGQGGESKMISSEFTLTRPLTNLYSVNRATLTHGYAAGSLTPDLDEVQTGPDGRKVFRKRPDLSSADALGTISLPADRVARLGVKSLPRLGRVYAWCEGDKWRALSPAAWYADESAEGAEMSSVDLERDTRVYVKWQWDVADGIVDKRD